MSVSVFGAGGEKAVQRPADRDYLFKQLSKLGKTPYYLEKLDAKFFPATRSKALHLCFENESINMQKLKDVISKIGLIVTDVNISRVISIKRVIIHFSVKAPKGDDYANLIEELKEIGELSEFSMTD